MQKTAKSTAINLNLRPRMREFVHISILKPDNLQSKPEIGDVIPVFTRGRFSYNAEITSFCVKPVADLNANDALSAGISGPGPVMQLICMLQNRLGYRANWRGRDTEIEILKLRCVC